MVARWGGDRVPPTWKQKEQDAGDLLAYSEHIPRGTFHETLWKRCVDYT